jgi:hypothetical protein
MLCVAVVVALDGAIASLAARLAIMAVVYLVIGGATTYFAGKRIAATRLDLDHELDEVGQTVDAVKAGLDA